MIKTTICTSPIEVTIVEDAMKIRFFPKTEKDENPQQSTFVLHFKNESDKKKLIKISLQNIVKSCSTYQHQN